MCGLRMGYKILLFCMHYDIIKANIREYIRVSKDILNLLYKWYHLDWVRYDD